MSRMMREDGRGEGGGGRGGNEEKVKKVSNTYHIG
jgi:hypothetical protein